MRIIEKYKQVMVGIILIVIGGAWLSTTHYDISILEMLPIVAGMLCISECEVENEYNTKDIRHINENNQEYIAEGNRMEKKNE